jgi:hypothetical protein
MRLMLELAENGVERGQVSMDVIQRRDFDRATLSRRVVRGGGCKRERAKGPITLSA